MLIICVSMHGWCQIRSSSVTARRNHDQVCSHYLQKNNFLVVACWKIFHNFMRSRFRNSEHSRCFGKTRSIPTGLLYDQSSSWDPCAIATDTVDNWYICSINENNFQTVFDRNLFILKEIWNQTLMIVLKWQRKSFHAWKNGSIIFGSGLVYGKVFQRELGHFYVHRKSLRDLTSSLRA